MKRNDVEKKKQTSKKNKTAVASTTLVEENSASFMIQRQKFPRKQASLPFLWMDMSDSSINVDRYYIGWNIPSFVGNIDKLQCPNKWRIHFEL